MAERINGFKNSVQIDWKNKPNDNIRVVSIERLFPYTSNVGAIVIHFDRISS